MRTRLAVETHARRMPILVELSIARLAYGSADMVAIPPQSDLQLVPFLSLIILILYGLYFDSSPCRRPVPSYSLPLFGDSPPRYVFGLSG